MTSYFLGANTPQGFVSEYDALFHDPRIRRLLILKGSPGCGKSTLMKAVAARAEALGHTAERILCSSDPDSLDGVVVPALGFAVADGTAPHVLEPPLCGLDAEYLDLGRFVDPAGLRAREAELRDAKRKNAELYVPVYGLLRAAGAVTDTLYALAAPYLTKDVLTLALQQLAQTPVRTAGRRGQALRRFLTGVTPKGALALAPECRTLWALEDGCGLGRALLTRLQGLWLRGGFDVIAVCSVTEPGSLAGLLVPELSLGYLRCEPLFGLGQQASLRLELDSVLADAATEVELERLAFLQRQQAVLTRRAVSCLREAKLEHDRMEAIYRDAVDFAGVSEETERVVKRMEAMG